MNELEEKLYARILRDFFNISEIHPNTAATFAEMYGLYIVSEVPLVVCGEQVGILRDVLCSNIPIDKSFINLLDGREDIVWSMNREGFTSFHLSDQDDDIKEKLKGVFDMDEVKHNVIVYDETLLFTETDELVEPPKPQNSVKRWKREKKYF